MPGCLSANIFAAGVHYPRGGPLSTGSCMASLSQSWADESSCVTQSSSSLRSILRFFSACSALAWRCLAKGSPLVFFAASIASSQFWRRCRRSSSLVTTLDWRQQPIGSSASATASRDSRVCGARFVEPILIAIAAGPAIALLRITPFLGRYLARVAAALWALHWVVIDAFDDARILEAGESLADVDAKNKAAPIPWFIRCFNWLADRLPPGLRRLTRSFARFCDKLSLEWREELALAEGHPSLVAGFGVMTAALLATPVLNLFFRPIIIVASVHLLGQVSRQKGD